MFSKLPKHKTSIFSVMSKMAFEHDAVNLSQGYPNFETDQRLKDLVAKAMNEGYNQYAPLAGIAPLREQIVKKIESLHGEKYDKDSEITVTNGATQALFLAITAFVNPGDEVIVLKPAYD
ncbi:aminotransferase class I/II-fold pyridoxal phosphate-dependent enzyme, partial [Tamlana crocina]|nr:aminotransferase class I/II-fold pyridoxal phosphate-dependent enzyme [Tamlana crocina]